jgi:bifunctional non-homologous end joining protein LigD
MTARVVNTLPAGDEWSYEVKLDGYRALIIKDGERVQLRSRTGKELTRTYQAVATAASGLRASQAVLDGEIVAVDTSGRPSFQALQHRTAHRDHTIVFYAFDLLHKDGADLMVLPLATRRERLAQVIGNSGILLSIELPGTPQEVIDAVSSLGLEGVIAKRRNSRYTPGERHSSWVKLKLDRQQEFVIGGYRPGPYGVDALLVGYYDEGGLRFAAKVRAGFTPHLRREVFAQLTPHHTLRCPFVDLPHAKASRWGGGVTVEQMAEMRWVRPAAVAQVRFVEWTGEGHLRHAAFLGLRTDKPARAIRRES